MILEPLHLVQFLDSEVVGGSMLIVNPFLCVSFAVDVGFCASLPETSAAEDAGIAEHKGPRAAFDVSVCAASIALTDLPVCLRRLLAADDARVALSD